MFLSQNILPFSLVMGNPARHVGWISKYAEKINLPLDGTGSWSSNTHNDSYSLRDGILIRDS